MRNRHRTSLPDMDFRHLRTFLTLARLGNFSQTGQHVGLSQSAVSRHIRALEDTLGLPLFQRLGRRAVLTSAGQTLRTRLETIMRETEAVPRVIRDLAEGVQGDIRIGASITAAHAVLPALLGAYRRRYPKVALALQPGNSADVLETLARGEIDLAFVGSDALPPGTSVVAEIPDQVLFIAPPAHPLAGRRLRSADLAGCDFIQRDAPSDTRALVGRWFQAERVEPRTVMEVG
ncbi:MAG: LysR family transcriptional regulator [Acidobacteria bacterium]|nr:LysR family transcriptional regulator [Acidobacteriota bacterium]